MIWARSISDRKPGREACNTRSGGSASLPCRRERLAGSVISGGLDAIGRRRRAMRSRGSGFAILMEGKTANLVSDSPDNLPIEGHVAGLGVVCHREFPMAHPPVAGLCGRDCAACRERAKLCRTRRGTWRAGMTKPCYDVGYGKPPLHTRFRKGQSSNPKGRSKGTKNFATIFMTAISNP